MNNAYGTALAEVHEVLLHLPVDMQSKIPNKLLEIIDKEKDKNYKVNIKHPLKIQDYSKEAVVLLGMIYTDYLCSLEEKNMLKKMTLESKQIYEKEISEKYNIDKLFKERHVNTNLIKDINKHNNTNTALIEYKESLFTKLKNFIFRILHKG